MQRTTFLSALLAAGLLVACSNGNDASAPYVCPTAPTTPGTGGAGTGGGDSTAGTGGSTGSGEALPTPQEVAARLHGCRKIRFAALGSMLRDRGVDITTFGGSGNTCNTGNPNSCPANESCFCPDPPCVAVGNESPNPGVCVAEPATPGFLYQTASDAFSMPKPDSRRGEKDGHSTASAMRLFDIFIQAAPQIIANIDDPQAAPACVLGGETFPMFNPDGSCVRESVSCLIGSPATDTHIELCNLMVDEADPNDPADVQNKRIIAVATLLSAAHSCE